MKKYIKTFYFDMIVMAVFWFKIKAFDLKLKILRFDKIQIFMLMSIICFHT